MKENEVLKGPKLYEISMPPRRNKQIKVIETYLLEVLQSFFSLRFAVYSVLFRWSLILGILFKAKKVFKQKLTDIFQQEDTWVLFLFPWISPQHSWLNTWPSNCNLKRCRLLRKDAMPVSLKFQKVGKIALVALQTEFSNESLWSKSEKQKSAERECKPHAPRVLTSL